jgi:hypothetical protein
MNDIIKCAKEGCKFKKGINKYCGKHQANHFLEIAESEGLKICMNYIRGCKVKNSMEYKYSKCEECLKKEREKDKIKRSTSVKPEQGKKQCTTCKNIHEIDHFQGKLGETSTCKVCRDSNKRADAKRDKEHINELARINAKKPERKAVKKEWKERNHEKCATYWIDARKRLIENDLEVYLKKNAERVKKWRENNPDKVKTINETKISSIESQYSVYKTSAINKRLEFILTKEEFTYMVKSPCYYCGIIQDKGFNGIDRLNSSENYKIENCVSCCEMCNMMKGSLGPSIFIHRVEHILSHLKMIQGKLYPDEFANVTIVSYNDYKKRAKNKELPFEFSEEAFTLKRNMCCYLCGKETNGSHKNGIDRIDNTKGYTEENTKSCCGNCNYLKRNYEYDKFLKKIFIIYEYQKIHPIHNNESKEIHNIVPGNKLSNFEKKEKYEINKKIQNDKLRDKYTNEENKKLWISEIVKNRKNK